MGSVPIKFTNEGVAQRVEPSDLQAGQYYDLSNMISSQEGTLEVRGGSYNIGNWGTALPGPIYSISKLRISPTDSANPRYFQTVGNPSSKMYRGFPAGYNASGTSTYAAPPTNITGAATLVQDRIGMTQFNSGDGNQPNLYIAGGLGNYRDNGAYTSLQRHGILPPTIPAQVFKGGVNVVPIAFTAAGPNARVNDTTSGVSPLATGLVAGPGGSGDYVITPTGASTTMALVTNSMVIQVGATLTIVDAVTPTTFSCWLPAQPAPGTTIKSYMSDAYPTPILAASTTAGGIGWLSQGNVAPQPSIYFTVINTSPLYTPINLAFSGLYADGYDSTDFIHIGIWVGGTSSSFANAHLKLFPGSPAIPPTVGDYYDALLTPASTSVVVQSSNSVLDQATQQALAAAIAAYYVQYNQMVQNLEQNHPGGVIPPPDPSSVYAQFNHTNTTVSSANPFITGTWMEFDIPKNAFTKVGKAGTGNYLWNSIAAWDVSFTSTSTTSQVSVVVSGIAGEGGGGPSTAIPGSSPYSYVYCVTSDTPILCDDLSWKPAGELVKGQGIIGFDEKDEHDGKRCSKRFRKASIVSNSFQIKECLEIRTDIGDPIRATEDHPWMVWEDNYSISKKSHGGLIWKKTSELRNGDRIAHFIKPWKEDESKRAGWLAGIFDGEGHITLVKSKSINPRWSGSSLMVGVAQNPGGVLDKIINQIDGIGASYYKYDKNKHSNAVTLTLTGCRNIIKFLGEIRPQRLLDKLYKMDYLPGLTRGRSYDLATISSICPVGNQEVASIQTSCGTFITGGYLSHNTYRNPVTLSESNPSVEMVDITRIAATYRQNIVVLNAPPYVTSLDSEINAIGKNTFSVYRAGGTFADDLYRFVGFASLPVTGTTALFTDNLTDASIASSRTVEFDNYAPVFATLPVTFIASIQSGSPTIGPGLVTLTLNNLPTGFTYAITPGSEIQVGWSNSSASSIQSNLETCIVQAYTNSVTTATITVYLQYAHYVGELVECEAVAGSPCRFAAQAYNSLFYAGDPLNPHILYMSKPGRPDSFPVITAATGTANQLVVGSPSNPIMNIVEVGGKLISMNLSEFYEIPIWNGTMQAPVKAGAQRGLMSSFGWAKGNNSIFYVATDGIYAWQGGASTKISSQIDWIFRDRTVNGLPPLDRTKLNDIICAYFQNSLYVAYTAVDGNSYYWVFDAEHARWHRVNKDNSL